MSKDKKGLKPVPYKPNLPELTMPPADLGELIVRIAERGRKKTAVFENIVEAPERIQ
jgi:hypothetical protein